jgi:TrpR family transcriptional regulator, trp operon repressor
MSSPSSEEHWKAFLELCLKTSSTEELNQLFELFFTIEEKETLASRFVIIKALLEEELTQRDISDVYKVSIAQITRGSNALKRTNAKLKTLLKERMKS